MVSLDVESLETLPPNTMLTVHITDKATVTSVFAHHCTIIITAMYRPYQPRPSWFSELSSDNGVSVKCQCVEHRFCTHEEADTCLLQHAKHAADSGAPSVVICLPDTDVTVICYHMQSRLQTPIYSRTGTQTRYVDISGVLWCHKCLCWKGKVCCLPTCVLLKKKIHFSMWQWIDCRYSEQSAVSFASTDITHVQCSPSWISPFPAGNAS